ncbi:MAG: FAD-dependent oxidoreductase [Desulfobacterales bacterium]|jgi:NADPH-dependent glutamate synthase beta subunit-like oxidoreductase/ferredoxin
MTAEKPPEKLIPLFLPHSSASTEINKTGSWRYVRPYYDEKTSPCSAACPLGEDIARIEMLASQKSFLQAWEMILKENPFPATCGRVCFHHCEQACNRSQFDDPVAIHQLERFLGDTAIYAQQLPEIRTLPDNGKKVAIAGAGPAGLGAAYFLACLGYRCEVFESQPEAGGILRWGIPRYRLPQDILQKEIKRIKSLGITIHCRTPVSAEMLETFKSRYDALFCGWGYGRAINLKIEGAQKAIDGLQFLYQIRAEEGVSLNEKGTAAVIGGGNTAIDVARTLVRMGVDPIIVYRRRRQDMPAFDPEVEMALNEGVQLKALLSPIRIEETASGSPPKAIKYLLTLQKMKVSATQIDGRARVVPDDDQTETLEVDHVFTAIGAEITESWQTISGNEHLSVKLSHCRLIHADTPIVYGGDLTNRVKSVADAIASGKQAAIALDTVFKSGWNAVYKAVADCQIGPGPAVSMAIYLGETRKNQNPHLVTYDEINTDYFRSVPRTDAPVLSADDRIRSFVPVESTFSKRAALEESRRCFNCGICNSCDICRLYCPEMSVLINDAGRRIDLDYCKGCGLCVAECPRNAMALKEEAT